MKISIFFFAILLSSCAMDYSCDAVIMNESGSKLLISIFYNKDSLDRALRLSKSNKNYPLFLKYEGEKFGQEFISDTSAFANHFQVSNNTSVNINHNIGGRFVEPDYSLIKKITIQYNCKFK
ncbi:MAG: hypothetical protein FD136_930 [Chitinophagaceae bacterium]|nr:MAG: hypothetical protein FD136_930 [Chitinophagaceae bacterium]